MVEKYGKEVDMRRIGRSLESVENTIEMLKNMNQRYSWNEKELKECPVCGSRDRGYLLLSLNDTNIMNVKAVAWCILRTCLRQMRCIPGKKLQMEVRESMRISLYREWT